MCRRLQPYVPEAATLCGRAAARRLLQAPRPLDNPPEVATMLLLLESFCDYAEVAAAELPSYLRTVMPSHRVR